MAKRVKRSVPKGGPNQQPGNAARGGLRPGSSPMAAPKRKGANLMSRKPGRGAGLY